MQILVRGTNWIGDAVMTIPAVKKLRQLFPDARLTLQTREWAEGIFRDSGLFAEIITPVGIVDQIRAIRNGQFDLAVVFPNSFKSALVARLGGAKRIFGYATEGRSFLLTDPVQVPQWKDTRHEVYYYLELVDAVERAFTGAVSEFSDLEPAIAIAPMHHYKARDTLANLGGNPNAKTIALAPGSTNSRAKRWHPESFAKLNDKLQEELGVQVVLLGSKEEADVSQRVADLSQRKPYDLTGKTDLTGAAGILSEIDLLVSNDMGLAHLAPAVGTKTLVIFGPTNPLTTRPFSEKASIITAAVECSPCMLRDCPIDHRCMTRVTVEDVFEQVRKNLSE